MGWWHYGNAQVDATEYDKVFLQPTLLHDLMQIKTFQTFMLLTPIIFLSAITVHANGSIHLATDCLINSDSKALTR